MMGAVGQRTARAPFARTTLTLAGLACLCCTACVSAREHTQPPNAIRLGTTLPFSGERAASGVALERALRLAVDKVNLTGRLPPLTLDVRDSHSDDTLGTARTLDLLDNEKIPFFVGPEEPKIAYQIANAIKAHHMVNLLPGLTSPQFHDPSSDAAWFHLSPSPDYLACALAKRMFADGITKANAITAPDDYSGTFATIFGRVFSDMGGTLLPGLQLSPDWASFSEVFATIERFSPDATLLIASPSVAAGFLQEWAVRGKVGKWYLGPPLNNPALLRNVPAGVLEGIFGISPDLGDKETAFSDYFESETAVPPLAGSHYYFDAVALLALAIAEGIAEEGEIPDPANFKRHLQNVSSTSGQIVSFNNLADGLAQIAAHQKVTYSGAAGSYILNEQGDSVENRATIWMITGDTFQDIGLEQCTNAEVYPGHSLP
jgi:ABC-type branched-subunit amino acid transport system substrate-binding protein